MRHDTTALALQLGVTALLPPPGNKYEETQRDEKHRYRVFSPLHLRRGAARRGAINYLWSDWFSSNLFIYGANSVTIYPSVDLNKLSALRIYTADTRLMNVSACVQKKESGL
jgi:hypothetical protein